MTNTLPLARVIGRHKLSQESQTVFLDVELKGQGFMGLGDDGKPKSDLPIKEAGLQTLSRLFNERGLNAQLAEPAISEALIRTENLSAGTMTIKHLDDFGISIGNNPNIQFDPMKKAKNALFDDATLGHLVFENQTAETVQETYRDILQNARQHPDQVLVL